MDTIDKQNVMAMLDHEAPLAWLVREKLHPGTTLADRVRKLRYKRRKVKQPTPFPEPKFTEGNPEEQGIMAWQAAYDSSLDESKPGEEEAS